MPLSAGIRLGPYEIVEPIGAGGMGEIYRAKDPRLGREVALKILREDTSQDPEAVLRFEREAKAVAALSHPNILAIFDIGAEQGMSYMVTELLEGETLRRRLTRGPMLWHKAAGIGIEIAKGLAAAHEKQIVHRDLKPENIFITRDGRVKILDFGVARLKTARLKPDETAPIETESGVVLGTIAYMSPEQIRGEAVEAPSDIFSLGCVLYEMISGRLPFAGDCAASRIAAILTQEPFQPIAPTGDVPAEIEQVILRCLEKYEPERIQSAREVVSRLRGVLSAQSRRPFGRAPTAQPAESIAVLPFVNASGDPDAEYLSDGITETLINNLSKLRNLRVAGRVTAFRYKGREIDPQSIGSELKTRTILTGKVVQHGDRLRVQTELLRTADGSQIWGEHYKRSISDVFEIEEEIAKEITDALELRLTSDENKQLGKRYTKNKEAYELYLQRKYLWNRRGSASLPRAVALFEQAIEKDPAYALAWAGIAECYTTYAFYEVVSPRESVPKAQEAAQTALAIDSTLAEPHACLGWIKSLYEWDWPGGEREFRQAIGLNPNLASAHYWFAFALAARRCWQDGIAESKRALEIDPANPRIYTILGPCLAGAGRIDEALEACRKGLELDPLFPNSHFAIALAYEANGRLDQSIPHLEQAHRNAANFPFFAGVLGRAYGLVGQTAKAQGILSELLQESERRYVAPFDIALVYFGLGDKDLEFAWLEKAWNDRSPWFVVCAGFTPWLLISEPDPRFDDLQRRMNLAG